MPELESVLQEKRTFKPSRAFSNAAHVKTLAEYKRLYDESLKSPEKFWGRMAKELHWFKPWKKVLEWNSPNAKWFVGGRTNLTYNCLDRHLGTWRKNKAALIWEGEPGDTRTLTYQELHHEVAKFANGLKKLGVRPRDRVAIYMPMIPELAIAMLACARIGATHSIVFGGFSAEALRDRINDAQAKVLVTADGGWRRGSVVPLKKLADAALENAPSIQSAVVVRRVGDAAPEGTGMTPGRDHWWHDLMAEADANCPAAPVDAEHPLFILYTSGTTGKPKGVVHTTGGYMVGTYLTSKLVFDLKDEDTYWCTADIGWVTGHSYTVYGPLANGATSLMYEGAPNFPDEGRLWSIVRKHAVSVFYTAPTAIRAFIRWGDKWPKKYDLTSLRLLGTVGEPINPEAWIWYHKTIGGERCPIVDTWWQTETGAIMITTLPGAMATKPGSAGLPFFGVDPVVVNHGGEPVKPNEGGFLTIRRPWPSMLRTLYKDPARFKKAYFGTYPGIYFTGDGARRDKDGYFWVMGRVDDVINVAGHRLGTMEVESALVSHPDVAEAAVVGKPDELKGSAIHAFVTLAGGKHGDDAMAKVLKDHVVKEIGAIARPDEIQFTDSLPKTRSGKIMRRLLRDVAAGTVTVGDTSTLEDLSVLAKLRAHEE